MSANHPTVGQLITDPAAAHRDAIHVAIAPVQADVSFQPGERVALDKHGKAIPGLFNKDIGIVDPFLKKPVKPGQWFYLFLHPNTVTSLRHEWTHNAFSSPKEQANNEPDKESVDVDAAMNRVYELANEVGLTYEDLLNAARDFIEHGVYLCDGGRWEGVSLPDTFWDDYTILTGDTVPSDKRWSFFSCSC